MKKQFITSCFFVTILLLVPFSVTAGDLRLTSERDSNAEKEEEFQSDSSVLTSSDEEIHDYVQNVLGKLTNYYIDNPIALEVIAEFDELLSMPARFICDWLWNRTDILLEKSDNASTLWSILYWNFRLILNAFLFELLCGWATTSTTTQAVVLPYTIWLADDITNISETLGLEPINVDTECGCINILSDTTQQNSH